ncbi:class I SAM-dependent methyltransferase [Xanthobacter sp. DSM 24535]|uniref:class I SAM-dependent methyltransferase n=1 Tax=Roseixanthobacter psychrophilus TaxID=3119917 RepID=UPI00372AF893
MTMTDLLEGEHERLISAQFGPQAAAYVTSAVHAKGADLDALAQMMSGRGAARVLDLGCGGGHVSFTVAPHVAHVVAYDLSDRMLEAVAAEAGRRGLANIETAQGVAEKLPFPDATFDFVISRYSAHHWRDLSAGLAETRRVLKQSGRAIFMDVVAPPSAVLDTFLQAVELLRDPSHARDFAVREWVERAREARLACQSVTDGRLRLEFGSWIARINTSELHAAAIRALQEMAVSDVRDHFAIEADGSFTLDTATLVFAPA